MKDMYINLALLGDGSPPNPWRVDMPTGYLVGIDHKHQQAVIRVPAVVYPDDLPDHDKSEYEPIYGALAMVYCTPALLAAWGAYLDTTYPRDTPWEPEPLRPAKEAEYTD